MERLELKFNKAETRLAGFPYGKTVYETQVKNKIRPGEKTEIVFPAQIEKVASSFVQGFFADLVETIGYTGIEENIVISASSETLTKTIRDNIY